MKSKMALRFKRVIIFLVLISMVFSFKPTYANMNPEATTTVFKVGDVIQFGSLNSKPILWRVIHVDELGNPLIFSEKIINLMPFDIGGKQLNMDPSGSREFIGTHLWKESFIKKWLNSTENIMNMPYLSNREFPTFFSMFNINSEEQKMILETNRKTEVSDFDLKFKIGGNSSTSDSYFFSTAELFKSYSNFNYTKDNERVFLLSNIELMNYVILQEKTFGKEFVKAHVLEDLNKTSFAAYSDVFKIENISGYWLRSPDSTRCDSVYAFNSDYTTVHADYVEGGIRPAMVLDKNKVQIMSGLGNTAQPYSIKSKNTDIISEPQNYEKFDFEVGQYLNFGMYNNEKITWRVIDIDAEGSPLIITDKILDIIVYDSPGDKYLNEDPMSGRATQGSNLWQNSNLRQWLNSSEENISWIGNIPSSENLNSPLISYSDWAGFLSTNHFTEAEQNVIKPTVHMTALSQYDEQYSESKVFNPKYFINDINIGALPDNDGYYQTITDKVYILSLREILESIMKNKHILGNDYFVGKVPDYVAYKMNESYIVADQYYSNYTRTPDLNSGSSIQILTIMNDPILKLMNDPILKLMNVTMVPNTIVTNHANADAGVRPAMRLDINKIKGVSGTGTYQKPLEMVTSSSNANSDVNNKAVENDASKRVPSLWAKESVNASISLGIVSSQLRNNYTKPITRLEFCTLMLGMLEKALNNRMYNVIVSRNIDIGLITFRDTDNVNMRQAKALGLINGFDGYAFPDATLKRGEAAVILMNACKFLQIDPIKLQTESFSDEPQMPEWCRTAVSYVTSTFKKDSIIMSGKGDVFDHLDTFTREQAMMVVYKLYALKVSN